MKQAATSQGLLPGGAARLRDTVTHPRGVPVPPVYGPTADEGRLG